MRDGARRDWMDGKSWDEVVYELGRDGTGRNKMGWDGVRVGVGWRKC